MQLVEAVILLMVGMLPGVWMTLLDFYAAGSSAFSAHVSLWLLLVMLLATNARYRRQAAWCAGWLSFGYIETYYLCSSFSFEGLARSHAAPLALLAVVGGAVAAVGWAAKRERGALGLALKALVIVATLVACVATHDGVSALDLVCTLIIAYTLFFMRSRKVALVRHQPEEEVVSHRPAAEQAAPVGRTDRASGRARRDSSRRQGTSATTHARRPDRAASATSGRPSRKAQPSQAKRDVRRPAAAEPQRPAARLDGMATGEGRRGAAAQRSGSNMARATSPSSRQGRGASQKKGSRPAAGASKTARSRSKSPRPTRRTGGAVPDANRIRSSASDRPRQRDARGSSRAGGTVRRR